MQYFFHPFPVPSQVVLDAEQSRHAVKVLRMGPGDELTLTDGQGGIYGTRITGADDKGCRLEVVYFTQAPPRPYRLVVGIAPPKSPERLEWFLEKATEIGIDRIVPLLCARSERRVLKAGRERKVLLSAMKQSMGAYLPRLEELTPFAEFVSGAPGVRLIGWCDPGVEKLTLMQAVQPGSEVCVLIGPEGDFTPEEFFLAQKAGFIPVTLGPTRLRVETAALMAVAAVATINQQSCAESGS